MEHFWGWISLFLLPIEEGRFSDFFFHSIFYLLYFSAKAQTPLADMPLLPLQHTLFSKSNKKHSSFLKLNPRTHHLYVFYNLVFHDENEILQGRRTSNGGGPSQRIEMPSMSLFQDELESEDYIFRTNIDEM